MRLFLALSLFVCPLVANAQGPFYDAAPSTNTVDGDYSVGGDLILTCSTCPSMIYQTAPTSDVAPSGISIRSANAYPLATGSNVYGGDTCALGGSGARKYTVLDYTACAADNVGVVINGVTNTLTAGAEWTVGANNDATCTSICSAVDALVGASCAACVGAVAPIVIDAGCRVVTLTSSDAACITAANYSDGQLLVPPGDMAKPGLSTPNDDDTGFYWLQDGYWYFVGNSTPSVYFYPGGMGMGLNKTLGLYGTGTDARLINVSDVPTVVGLPLTDNHSQGLGSAGTGGAFIANGVSYLDGYIEVPEQATPSAAPANSGRIYAKDNGSGKTQLCVIFATGAEQCFATEP